MSETAPTTRARRSDAEANVARVLAAALDLLGRGADPSMADVAAAAGVSRQTVYSHFPNRDALYAALVARLTTEAAAALDAEIDVTDPAAALTSWLDRAWGLLDRYPALLNPALFARTAQDPDVMAAHEPITGGLHRILAGATEHGVLAAASRDWLTAAVIALGHAAGQEVAAGRATAEEAGAAFKASALRVCLA